MYEARHYLRRRRLGAQSHTRQQGSTRGLLRVTSLWLVRLQCHILHLFTQGFKKAFTDAASTLEGSGHGDVGGSADSICSNDIT